MRYLSAAGFRMAINAGREAACGCVKEHSEEDLTEEKIGMRADETEGVTFVREKLYIGGQWIDPHGRGTIESYDPTTGKVWARVPEADRIDVAKAVTSAGDALRGPWSRAEPGARASLLWRLSSLILDRVGDIANAESRDNGKPINETESEVRRAAEWYRYFAGAADKIHGETIPFRPGSLAYTRREPIGVVAAITPWNSPFQMYSWKLGPALAAGCTVVLKPSEVTPVTSLVLAQLIEEAGFPPGVVNVVPGTGEGAGRALVQDPGVAKVAFTGEHSTAQAIMRMSAEHLHRLTFECGGKAPHIFFPDCDLDRATDVAVYAGFRSTGQSCTIGSRIFVHDAIYDQFLSRFVSKAAGVVVGPALDRRSDIGPHSSSTQLEKTLRYIQLGRDDGGTVMLGGGRPASLGEGYFVEPTIFVGLPAESAVMKDEIFGPVVSVVPFASEDEAVRLANDVKYGLVAGVWTRDVSRAHRVAERLDCGVVSVNTYRPVHWMLPYGGRKLSGIGRENGMEAIREYTEVKTVVVQIEDATDNVFQRR